MSKTTSKKVSTAPTIEELRARFGAADARQKENQERHDKGEYTMLAKIIEMSIETFESQSGKEFDRLVVDYRNLGNNSVQSRKTPLFTDEAKYLAFEIGIEEGKTYEIKSVKGKTGYWSWETVTLQEGEE